MNWTNSSEALPYQVCTRHPAVALPSSTASRFYYVNNWHWCKFVEGDTRYGKLNYEDNKLKLALGTHAQSPSGWLCVAKSCVMLSSRWLALFQMVDFRASQQLSTQLTEIPQLFCKKVVIVGGRISGGLNASTEDGCARRMLSFNFEASEMNCWTWPKESSGYLWLKATTSCNFKEDIADV